MEFFVDIPRPVTTRELTAALTIERLPQFCESIDRVLSVDGERGEIYCLWGQFRVHREPIRDGVRFSLPGCPNALAWTVTTNPADPPALTVHCTINRRSHDPDFIESIELFVADWAAGLTDSTLLGSATP